MVRNETPASAAGSAVGSIVELEITNVAHGGVFVARHEGRVVFVSDTLPGERVLARISDDTHRSFWRAETIEVIQASEHRRPHIWTAAALERTPEDRAGGAEFGHIALAHQRELKRFVITDSLSRMAGLDGDVVVQAAAGDDDANGLGWRTRIRLHVDDDGRVGPYAARSHRVVAVEDLPLAASRLAEAAPLAEHFAGAESVDLVAPSVGPVQVLIDQADRPAEQNVIHERVAEREFAVDARGFWQVHEQAALTLYRAVQDAVDEAAFDPAAANLDLYGGVGLLAAALGDRFGPATRVTSVESSETATEFAGRNLADWVGASAVTDRVDRYLGRIARQASATERARLSKATVILDPPRSGAGKAVVGQLAELHPAQIVYVACDPVALARDVALFAPRGYELRTLNAFDLFPHTHHVEAVAVLAPVG